MSTEPSTDLVPVHDFEDTPADAADAANLIETIAEMAAAQGSNVQTPFAQGTFAMYAMPDGGIMVATYGDGGLMEGTKHTRISPFIIKGMLALTGAGGGIKGLLGIGKRKRAKEIEG